MNKKEIVICLGSSCFSRSNKMTVRVVQNYIEERDLKEEVFFHGAHCMGGCDRGPFLEIDGKRYEKVTPDNVIPLLNSIFGE
ncbi:MAG: electron transport complex protein RnfG [Bacteroidetes bacterium]|nr:MAG: electron transport complex protein RnfG [Bacteroidota bacterium]PIE88664.1 MAG: electron transport complex protein RnfG [Bacteroidota bacterium]